MWSRALLETQALNPNERQGVGIYIVRLQKTTLDMRLVTENVGDGSKVLSSELTWRGAG